MAGKFYCPHCEGRLDIHQYVAFTAKSNNGSMGLLLLSPHLGNYDVWHDEKFSFKEKELVKYFCPICHHNLTADELHEHLIKIHMIDDEDNNHIVVFSGVAGEHATYQLRDDELVDHYGKGSEEYMYLFTQHRM
ncbi:hypothetical protein KJ708_06895 [bacterium]|nr:hypothetical protein [bacterium]MBU1917820.1 hypothetical protein [bacterium]